MIEPRVTSAPLIIREQGSFAAGGSVRVGPDGQTLHGDHAYVFYQLPVGPQKLPIIFVHGHLQFSKTWETTPDGREGFQTIFLRRGHGIYVVDCPRRGRAGQSIEPGIIASQPEDQLWFNIFRVGIWPDYFKDVQFDRQPDTLNQYFRQTTPNTGPFDVQVAANAIAALLHKIGPAVLVTHSQGGGVGWLARLRSNNIRAIVSYEPGSNFPFPAGEVPTALQSSAGPLEPMSISGEEFGHLTGIPIVIYYGDYIPSQPSLNPGQDQWRVRLEMARKWADVVNRRGGDASVVHLPDIGILGNTHFPFSDLNNLHIAGLMSDFLERNGLAGQAP